MLTFLEQSDQSEQERIPFLFSCPRTRETHFLS